MQFIRQSDVGAAVRLALLTAVTLRFADGSG